MRKLILGLVLCAVALAAASCGGSSSEFVDGSSSWDQMHWDETVWR